ncbi:OmpA family protein [Thioclava atlantica]|uniref:OmpA/MotB domain-containing protein n=1 Tax=Thioclava atlantica TaxID=1317124 RepID=A0A085TVS2_9RHOB|nr:OmpA family protein [Thioclava atlantica]KFE34819.1 OmpA/MotB domain-containing protein [Thioclava atlantica]
MYARAAIAFGLALLASAAQGEPVTLKLPGGASQSAQEASPATSYKLAIGPWQDDEVKSLTLEGARSDTAWRLRSNQNTTLQILAPLRDQLQQAGYTILFECATDACGGFDFRYRLDLLPEPSMHVDLGDFRYLAARNGSDYVAITVSRSSESGFVQVTDMSVQDVTPAQPDNPLAAPQTAAPLPTTAEAPTTPTAFAQALEAQGSVALDDLDFPSGAADLGPGEFGSLKALADYLKANSAMQVMLVGHTDAVGSLAANIALSKKRAEAVRSKLVSDYGVDPNQISAEGAGFLAPRASNLTKEGREKNRRVEAVLTSTRS